MDSFALDSFTLAYVECAMWSSSDDGGEPLDKGYTIYDIESSSLESIIADCADFQAANADLLDMWYMHCGENKERAGHDFWLTRNRHGAGFWDRWASGTWQGKIGNALADAARVYGSSCLYIGDDGKVRVL